MVGRFLTSSWAGSSVRLQKLTTTEEGQYQSRLTGTAVIRVCLQVVPLWAVFVTYHRVVTLMVTDSSAGLLMPNVFDDCLCICTLNIDF